MIIDEHNGKVVVAPTARVEETAVLIGPCVIGGGTYIGHNCVIGAPPQYKGYWPNPLHAARANGGVMIGSKVVVRELTQIHQGIQSHTFVGDESYLMAGCHIAHDASIGAWCTLGSFSTLGGHTRIGARVTFGQGVVTHPWVMIGEGAMVGLNSSVINDVMPYQKVAGSPAKLIGKNTGPGGDKEAWTFGCLDESAWLIYDHHVRHRNKLKKEMQDDAHPRRRSQLD